MSQKRSIAYIPAVLSFLLSAGTMTVFRACSAKDDGTWMHCHTAQNLAAAGGCLLCILFVVCIFVKAPERRAALYAAGTAGAAVVFMIPGSIVSMCMMNTMRCYVVMQPFVRVMSVLIAAAGAVNIIAALNCRTGNQRKHRPS